MKNLDAIRHEIIRPNNRSDGRPLPLASIFVRTKCIKCNGVIEVPHTARIRCRQCQDEEYKRQRSNRYKGELKKSNNQKFKYISVPTFECPKCGRDHFKELIELQKENGEKPEDENIRRHYS